MNDEYQYQFKFSYRMPEELLARIVARLRVLELNNSILTPLHPSAFLQWDRADRREGSNV